MSLRYSDEFVDDLMDVEADHGGNIEKLDEVDTSLAALDIRDERLMPAKLHCDLTLRKTSRFSRGHKKLDQSTLAN